jgi:hypothetical protein
MSGAELLMITASAAQATGAVMRGISAFQTSRVQAELTRREGEQALQAAQQEQDAILIEGDRVMGEARAQAGASGFDLSGSASDILAGLASERSIAARTAMVEGDAARTAAMVQAREIKRAGNAELLSGLVEGAGAAAQGAFNVKQGRAEAARHQTAMASTRAATPARPGPPVTPGTPVAASAYRRSGPGLGRAPSMTARARVRTRGPWHEN